MTAMMHLVMMLEKLRQDPRNECVAERTSLAKLSVFAMIVHTFVEKLSSLNQVLLHLYWDKDDGSGAIDSRVDFASDAVTVRFRSVDAADDGDDGFDTEMRFHCDGGDDDDESSRFDASLCAVTLVGERWITMRLATTRNAKLCAPVLLDGKLFQASALRSLCCRNCLSRIVDGCSFERVLPLPSPGWLELSELWNCACSHSSEDNSASLLDESGIDTRGFGHAHSQTCSHKLFRFANLSSSVCAPAAGASAAPSVAEQTVNNRLDGLRTEITAQRRLCLVGTTTLLVHSSCVLADAVEFKSVLATRGMTVPMHVDQLMGSRLLGMHCRQCRQLVAHVVSEKLLDNTLEQLRSVSDVHLLSRSLSTPNSTAELFG
jgi:hypothetical protein